MLFQKKCSNVNAFAPAKLAIFSIKQFFSSKPKTPAVLNFECIFAIHALQPDH